MPSTSPAPRSSQTPAEVVPDAVRTELASLFSTAVDEHRTAGVTWAVIGGHEHDREILAHGAAGQRELLDGMPAPGSGPMDEATVSRIASMTKSFTAATILALRDEGALRLDDPISQYVPAAAGAFALAADDREPTLRQLLSMNAGLVTDNPWGDRQEAMSPEDFDAMLRQGLGAVHRPGTGFEYSNTGYVLLGRVIDEVTGNSYREEIRERFLDPLGLRDTGWSDVEIDKDQLAVGHRVADRTDATRFESVPLSGPGAYGAMAGLFSTVTDVARWVRFLAAADAPDAAERPRGPLATASRREMQQMHRHQMLPARRPHASPEAGAADQSTDAGSFDRIRGYGFGLVIEQFPDLGEVISHSGGYPGYGSFMAWHRGSGVGIVALANSKYAPAVPLGMQALRVLQRELPQLLAPAPIPLGPCTRTAAEAALAWLRTDNSYLADRFFADNMDPDVPRAERRRRLDAALAASGRNMQDIAQLVVDDAEVITPQQLRWRLTAREEGQEDLVIDLLMDPRREALLQALNVSSIARR